MADLEELVVKLTANSDSLKTELISAARTTKEQLAAMQDSLDELAKKSSETTGHMSAAFAVFTGMLGEHAVEKALELIKEGFEFLSEQLIEGAQDAAKQETALQSLANTLQISGKYTEETQKSLHEFSEEMQHLTGVQKDVVTSNLTVLSSITKLNGEGLKQAEKAALGLSAAYKIDLDSAIRLVGKGIEGHTEAFKRYGIEIQGTADKQLNLANIMKALPFEAALAKTNTFAGSLSMAQIQIKEFFESLGQAAVINPVVVAVMNEITNIFHELTSATSENAIALREGFATALLFSIDALMMGIEVSSKFIQIMTAGFKTIVVAAAAVNDSIDFVVDKLTGVDRPDAFKDTKKSFESLQATTDNPTWGDAINGKLAQIKTAGEEAFKKIGESANEATPSVGVHESALKRLTEAQKNHNQAVKEFSEGLAGDQNKIGSYYAFQEDVLKNAVETEKITKKTFYDEMKILQDQSFAEESAALKEAHAKNLITNQQFADASKQIAIKQAQAEMALNTEKTKSEKEAQKIRAENLKSSFATIATLSTSGNATLAAIGKAAAITNATIDGIAAVQKALAAAPPPFNFALAGIVGVAAAANVAKIAGVGLASGITEIPNGSGGGNSGDNFPAILKPGERVVDSDTNQDLKAALKNGSIGGTNINITLNIAPGTGISRAQASDIVKGLNDYLVSGGAKLITGAR